MLRVTIPPTETYDEATNQFIGIGAWELELEHSLVSVSKWEARWGIPFLDGKDKTPEQTLDYIRAMTITPNVPPEVYYVIPRSAIDEITAYISASMTATWFNEKKTQPAREAITSELIYYWMIASNVPFECQTWHLNRLITLIRVCQAKSSNQKKMSSREVAEQNRALNEARRAKLGSKG